MAYTTIDDPSAHFQSFLYTGNGANRTITLPGNSDLKFDFYWYKQRSQTGHHRIFDTTRGLSLELYPDLTNAESSATYFNNQQANSFDIIANDSATNTGDVTFANWQWKANGGTTSTNTTGNGIDTVVQANAAAGFSIITYTGNGTQSGQTVGHGLGAVPKMIISKDRTNSSNVVSWRVYHVGIGPTKYMELQSAAALATYNDWDDTAPTSSVYSVGGAGGYTPTNTNNALYVAYVFAEVQGYSKFGKYFGTGVNGNGAFVYTGFKPAWVMVKNTTLAGYYWVMLDNKRSPTNLASNGLNANTNEAEANTPTDFGIDFLSNGFKIRAVNTGYAGGAAGNTLIYMAFAENPFTTSTGIPTTAR